MKKQKTFASLVDSFKGDSEYDLRAVFDDFLTILLCTYSTDDRTGLPQDEKLLTETMLKYPEHVTQLLFPELLITLQTETQERCDSADGNDVIGEYYAANFGNASMAKSFLTWDECQRVAKDIIGRLKVPGGSRMRFFIPCCGSGRLLVAARQQAGWQNEFYGIESDSTFVKMAILNLYYNPVYYGEVMQADMSVPIEFKGSYMSPAFPEGIFKVDDREQSRQWHLLSQNFSDRPAHGDLNNLIAVEVR